MRKNVIKLMELCKINKHFISIDVTDCADTIAVEKMIFSAEMRILMKFNDVMISTHANEIINISIFKTINK